MSLDQAKHTRADDPDGIKIDRTIPLWGILTLAGGLVGQAVLMWNAQTLQAAEIHHQSEQIQELAKQVSRLSEKFEAKEGVDREQDLRIGEISRRVTALEVEQGRK
jgi:hypothetical protein